MIQSFKKQKKIFIQNYKSKPDKNIEKMLSVSKYSENLGTYNLRKEGHYYVCLLRFYSY